MTFALCSSASADGANLIAAGEARHSFARSVARCFLASGVFRDDEVVTMNKDYLGDSVYAEWDGYHVVLTTENGFPTDPSNRIALDPDVLAALQRYVARVKAEGTKEPGP